MTRLTSGSQPHKSHNISAEWHPAKRKKKKKRKRKGVTITHSSMPKRLKRTPFTSVTKRVATITRPKASTQRTNRFAKIPGLNHLRRKLSSATEKLTVYAQVLLPHHTFSRLFGMISNCRTPMIKNFLINNFIRLHGIDMKETVKASADDFDCFNDFFTRKLKPEARKIAPEGQVASPVDGTIGQIGAIDDGKLIQAKDQKFTLEDLLGGDTKAAEIFKDGKFATMYLSPTDYHHYHMPVDATLISTTHIPGKLFSVGPKTVRNLPNIFARNERLIAMFETDQGPMAMIMVGAINVSSIETTWGGLANPHQWSGDRYKTVTTNYTDKKAPTHLEKGSDAGNFKLGSTVICLFGKNYANFLEDLGQGDKVKMGQPISQPSQAVG